MTKANFLRNVATIVACLAVTTAFASCEPADEPAPGAPAFAEFSFASQRGTADIDAKKRTVKAVAECGTNLAALAPAFKLSPEGATATVDGKAQESGKTANNFADVVVYTLAAPDGTTAEWTVTVTLPDDCPQVKKYITYNKPVTAYFIEYNGGVIDANKSTSVSKNNGLVIEAYENGKFSRVEWTGYDWVIYYSPAPNAEWYYNSVYGSNEWLRETNPDDSGIEYNNYPLDRFAAWVTKDKRSGGDGFMKHRGAYDEDGKAFGYGLYANARFPDKYELPNNTDVTKFYLKSEKVGEIMCDVYQDKETVLSEGTETWTFWVDPSTGFTLKYENIDYDGDIKYAYEVSKIIVGKPDWDGKHLHPLATDKITDSGY